MVWHPAAAAARRKAFLASFCKLRFRSTRRRTLPLKLGHNKEPHVHLQLSVSDCHGAVGSVITRVYQYGEGVRERIRTRDQWPWSPVEWQNNIEKYPSTTTTVVATGWTLAVNSDSRIRDEARHGQIRLHHQEGLSPGEASQ